MALNEMTISQRKAWDFINQCYLEHKPSPTLKEIADHMGFTSIGGSQFFINSMIEKGYLLHEKGKMRALVCVPLEAENEA